MGSLYMNSKKQSEAPTSMNSEFRWTSEEDNAQITTCYAAFETNTSRQTILSYHRETL